MCLDLFHREYLVKTDRKKQSFLQDPVSLFLVQDFANYFLSRVNDLSSPCHHKNIDIHNQMLNKVCILLGILNYSENSAYMADPRVI